METKFNHDDSKAPVVNNFQMFTDAELWLFDRELNDEFSEMHTRLNGDQIKIIRWEEWMVKQGAYAKGRGLYEGQYHVAFKPVEGGYDDSIYRRSMDKIRQWKKYIERREFAQNNQAEFYDAQAQAIAGDMRVEEEEVRKPITEIPFKPRDEKYTLNRSAINRYKEKHGIEYQIPEGTVINEDL